MGKVKGLCCSCRLLFFRCLGWWKKGTSEVAVTIHIVHTSWLIKQNLKVKSLSSTYTSTHFRDMDKLWGISILELEPFAEVCIPVEGQNLAARSQEAGKAAYSREYGFVHASCIRSDCGCGAPCTHNSQLDIWKPSENWRHCGTCEAVNKQFHLFYLENIVVRISFPFLNLSNFLSDGYQGITKSV